MGLRVQLKIAGNDLEVNLCKSLIERIYKKNYNASFTDDDALVNPELCREPFPKKFLMALIDHQMVGCVGLYPDNTYAEKYGRVSKADIDRILADKKYTPPFEYTLREITKIVVEEGWAKNNNIGLFLGAAANSQDFIFFDGNRSAIIICCAKHSIYRYFHRELRINTTYIKPFPSYKVHERYASEHDPMEIRITIPMLDIPKKFLQLKIPGEYDIDEYIS